MIEIIRERQRVKTDCGSYVEPALARCTCGTEFALTDEYMGACSCPNCGRWYNLFGQSLRNPSEWEENY